ncbi:hypothetical protein BDV06DRAFT_167340 [Aspergillus oleicola]
MRRQIKHGLLRGRDIRVIIDLWVLPLLAMAQVRAPTQKTTIIQLSYAMRGRKHGSSVLLLHQGAPQYDWRKAALMLRRSYEKV